MPAYKDILSLFPNPTEPYASGAASALWRGASADDGDDNHYVFRGDYNISANDRLSGRYTRGRPFRNQPNRSSDESPVVYLCVRLANLSWVHAAPSWTSETRAGLNYTDAERLQTGLCCAEFLASMFRAPTFQRWSRISDADRPHLQH